MSLYINSDMNTNRTINQLIEDFLIDQDINDQSKRCYRGNLKQFIHFCIIQNIKTEIVKYEVNR